jgi:hypothetical protein
MRIRTVTLPTIFLVCLALAGCGGESSSSQDQVDRNAPPIITGAPPTQLMAGTAYTFTPTAQDPDGDPLTFSAENLPGWLQIDQATGRIWGTPTQANVGMTGEITIEAFDQKAHSELPAFRINVMSEELPPVQENRPPTIGGTPGTTATVGKTYTFAPTADDPDDDALTFSITNRPSWATFTASTGALTGTPPVGASNVSGIVIRVSDGNFTTSLPSFNLQIVTEAPPNRAPTISGTPPASATAGTFYSFRPTASDPDGDTLSFAIQNKPTWANFSTTTGRLSGTPAASNAGTSARITISVTDQVETASLASFTIQVTAPNARPTISGTPATQVAAGASYNFLPTASDPEGATLTFSIQNKPSWATFSTTTGRLFGTPTAAQAGAYNGIIIGVSDGTTLVNLPTFNITVGGGTTNQPPTISGSPTLSVTVGTAYAFTPTASDPEGATLSFSIQNKPAWATFNTATGRLSGTPALGDVLTYSNIIISVSDGTNSVSLPGFALAVVQVVTGSVTLTWVPPLTNTDGSALDLAGYRVSYGRSSTSLDQLVQIANPGVTTYMIDNLAQGAWFFSIRAYSNSGAQSDPSNVATKTIQ